MKKIKDISLKISFTCGGGGYEIDEDVALGLDEACERGELDGFGGDYTENLNAAIAWVQAHFSDSDACNYDIQVVDVEFEEETDK